MGAKSHPFSHMKSRQMCNWKYDEHAKEGVGLESIVDITILLIVFLLVGCANVEPQAQPPS